MIPQYKYIYEFDYEKFFDNLNQGSVKSTLLIMIGEHLDPRTSSASFWKRKDAAQKFMQRLTAINNCLPKLPEDQKIDEGREKQEELRAFHLKTHKVMVEGGDFMPMLKKMMEEEVYYKGVPQGAPTSPFLAILTLNEAAGEWGSLESELSDVKTVRYADDGLIFSNTEIDHLEEARVSIPMLEANIKISPSKSGWVMKNGA